MDGVFNEILLKTIRWELLVVMRRWEDVSQKESHKSFFQYFLFFFLSVFYIFFGGVVIGWYL